MQPLPIPNYIKDELIFEAQALKFTLLSKVGLKVEHISRIQSIKTMQHLTGNKSYTTKY